MFDKTYINQESEKSTEQTIIIEKGKIIKSLISQREDLVKRLISLSLIRYYDDGSVILFRKEESDCIQQEIREFDKLFSKVILDFLNVFLNSKDKKEEVKEESPDLDPVNDRQ